MPSLNLPSEHTEVQRVQFKQVESFSIHSRGNYSTQVKVDRAVQTDEVMISDIKKNTFVVNKDKNILTYRTYHNR